MDFSESLTACRLDLMSSGSPSVPVGVPEEEQEVRQPAATMKLPGFGKLFGFGKKKKM